MNGRKTMKTWQMIVAVVLLAAMLITIFLPAIHLNGKSLRKALEKVVLISCKIQQPTVILTG